MVYKRECEQFVIWPVILLAPRGGEDWCSEFRKKHTGKLEGAVSLLPVFLVCAINHLYQWEEHSLFNFETVFGIVAVS